MTAKTASVRILQGSENLSRYTWGTHTAQNNLCKTCGIYTHHQRRSDPAETGINLGCIEGVLPNMLEPIPTTDGKNWPLD